MLEGVYYSPFTDEIGIVTIEHNVLWFEVKRFDYCFRVPFLKLVYMGEF